MKRVSVSEIQTWQSCRQKWQYQYQARLRPLPQEDNNGFLLSGRAVHHAIEQAFKSTHDRPRIAEAAAISYLGQFGEKGNIYARGVASCLEGVPQEIWEMANPNSEQKFEAIYNRGG